MTKTSKDIYPRGSSQYRKSDTQAFANIIWALDFDYNRCSEFPIQNRTNNIIESTTLSEEKFQYPPIDTPSVTLLDTIRKPSTKQPEIVLIATMAPEPLEVIRAFPVTIQPYEDEFRANFTDANLSAFGSTQNEAIWNLKDIIAITFDTLTSHEQSKLSRGLSRQLAVLKSFLRKRKWQCQ